MNGCNARVKARVRDNDNGKEREPEVRARSKKNNNIVGEKRVRFIGVSARKLREMSTHHQSLPNPEKSSLVDCHFRETPSSLIWHR